MMFTPSEPTDTLLVLAPLEGDANGHVQHWQLTYINSVGGGDTGGFTRWPTPLTRTGTELLMVIPIPNRHGMAEEDFVLSAAENNDVEKMRRHGKNAFTPYRPPQADPTPTGVFGGGAPASAGSPLLVQEVGAYEISVAATLHDLEQRAPWTRFPSAAGRVEAIVANLRACYPEGFGFVIAQSKRAVKESGFSVVYRALQPFVPTAHEIQAVNPSGLVEMDATIYAFNTVLLPHSVGIERHMEAPNETRVFGDGNTYPSYRVDDCNLRTLGSSSRWFSAVGLLRALPVRGAGELHRSKLLRHAKPTMLCYWRLKGRFKNDNVIGRVAMPSDVQAMSDIFEQLDAFITKRSLLGESALVTDYLASLHTSGTLGVDSMPASGSQMSRGQSGFGGFGAFGGLGGAQGTRREPDPLRLYGKIVDFAIVLEGRQLAYPGISDRKADNYPSATTQSVRTQSEIFLNLDTAAVWYGLDSCIDLDTAGFARKDTPEFLTIAHEHSTHTLVGTVYLRISATPAPYLMPMEHRTVKA